MKKHIALFLVFVFYFAILPPWSSLRLLNDASAANFNYNVKNIYGDNTSELTGIKGVTGNSTGSITGFSIPLYVTNSLSVYDALTSWVDVRTYLPVGFVKDNSVVYTSQVQNAINAVDNDLVGGGVVRFPAGLKIKTDAPLTISGKNNVWLLFDGWSAQIYNAGTGNTITVGSTAGDNTADIRILGGWLKGNAASSHGVQVLRNHSMRIEGMRISGHGGDGINFDRAYANWILNNYINNNSGDGFEANELNDFSIITGNKILANTGKGVYFSNGDSSGSIIDKNDIEGNGIGIQIDCGNSGSTESFTITRNYIENQVGKSILLCTDNTSPHRLRNPLISSNTIRTTTGGDYTTNAVNMDLVQWPTIIGNLFNVNVTKTANTQWMILLGNHWSGATPLAGGLINTATGNLIIRDDTAGHLKLGTSADWAVDFYQNDNVAWTITDHPTGKRDFKAADAGAGIILRNAADNVVKRVRLNDAGNGLVFEAE